MRRQGIAALKIEIRRQSISLEKIDVLLLEHLTITEALLKMHPVEP